VSKADSRADDLQRCGRLPGGYVYYLDGWLECRACLVQAPYPGEVPRHTPECVVRVAELEQERKGRER